MVSCNIAMIVILYNVLNIESDTEQEKLSVHCSMVELAV